jgi:hypothetical protein
MPELKITFDQLKLYLNTGLLIDTSYRELLPLQSVTHIRAIEKGNGKPVCYRLAWLHYYIPEGSEKSLGDQFGWNPLFSASNIQGLLSGNLRYHYYQELVKHHFWIFGDEYIDQGLVVDKNKLEMNRKEANHVS